MTGAGGREVWTTSRGEVDGRSSELDAAVEQNGEVGEELSGRLPAGTVTFLFTDIEGSSSRWERDGGAMRDALAHHDEALRRAIEGRGGSVVKHTGDGVMAVFAEAGAAIAAAVEAHQTVEDLPVRIGIHTGSAEPARGGDYLGLTPTRAARVMSAAHGGQILVSGATAALAADHLPGEVALVDLGEHRVRGLERAEHLWQVKHPALRSEFPPLHRGRSAAGNLSTPTTAIIGRDAELAAVAALLTRERLVTLTGSGGCGKTTLALHAANASLTDDASGVWWVELAPLAVASQVPDRVAASVGMSPSLSTDSTDDMVAYLNGLGSVLLVLDNAEHVIDEAARVVDAVLRGCPRARLLVTSREALGLFGEVLFRVPSLAVPPSGQPVTAAGLDDFDAARLFLDRARRVRPTLIVDDRAAQHVAAICVRLDGIPLALELAAARAASMPLARVALELDDVFRLLTGGSRTALPRQQTLHASIAWSVDLLDTVERSVLSRLAIFRGSFPLPAAEAIASDDLLVDRFAVIDSVGRLVDKSLVQLNDATGHYRLLDTIRRFALDRLRRTGDLAPTEARHCRWYAERAVEIGGITGVGISPSDDGLPDVFAALDWAYDNDAAEAYRISRGLGWNRSLIGHITEFRRQYEWVTRRSGSDDAAGWAGAVAGLCFPAMVTNRLDYPEFVDRARRCLPSDDGATSRLLEWFGRSMAGLRAADLTGLEAGWREAIADGDDIARLRYAEHTALHAAVQGRHAVVHECVPDTIATLDRVGLRFTVHTGRGAYTALLATLCNEGRLSEARDLTEGFSLGDSGATVMEAARQVARLGWLTGEAELIAVASKQMSEELWEKWQGPALGLAFYAARRDGLDEVALRLAGAAYEAYSTTPGLRGDSLLAFVVELLRAGRRRDVDEHLAEFTGDIDPIGRPPTAVVHRELIEALVARHDDRPDGVELHGHALLEAATGSGYALFTVDALELLAETAVRRGDEVRAARLFGAADGHRRRVGYVARIVPDSETVGIAVDRLRNEQAAAFDDGHTLGLLEAVEFARRTRGERGRPSFGWASLTATETKVVELVAQGLSNEQVARTLLMSPATAKTHLTHIYAKLGASNRTELAARWRDR
jgi:predicted ATPase/class 3 adenylate cyclase/DNA-binding CsgD family transcriptional regulator